MKHHGFRRLLACCLVLVMVLSGSPANVRAAQGGQFVLAAIGQEQVIIAPEYCGYDTGDTLRTALKNSGHTFDGIDTGFIATIDGVTDNFSLFYDDGGYSLDVSADAVTVVCFTACQEQVFPQYLALLKTMADYNGSTNGVKNNPAAQEAYANALAGLYGATAEQAEALQRALQTAMDDYDAYLKGETVTLHIAATQGTASNIAVNAVFQGSFGNTYQVEHATAMELIPGTYTFDLSDGGINHVRGSVTVTQEQTLSAVLPTGTWLANVDMSIANGDGWSAVERDGNVYYVPDYAAGNLYPYLEPGEGVDTAACGVYLANTPDASRRTWLSRQTVLSGLIPPNSMEGADFALEARMTDGTWEQYQRYPIQIVRIPTLSGLTVTGDGTLLPLSFDLAETEYAVTTVSDTLQITALPLCQSAVVSVNGKTGTTGNVPVAGTGGQIPIQVSHANGQKTVYTLQVTKMTPVDVTVNHAQGVTIAVYNEAGASIAPKFQTGSATAFALIPGAAYTYVATKDTYYHTSAQFTAAQNLTVSAPTPDTADWLSALHVGPTKGVAYPSDAAFTPATHTYTYQVGSNQTAFGIVATLADTAVDCTIMGFYSDYRDWNPAYGQRTLPLASGTYKSTTTFLGASGKGNTMQLQISKNQNGVTYYQDYNLIARRLLQVNDLTCATQGQSLSLVQKDGTQKFDKEILNYTVSLGQMQTDITVGVKLFNTTSGNDNGFTLTLTCGEHTQTVDYAALAVNEVQSVTLPLDSTQAEEQITIRVEHDDAITQTYTVSVQKLPPVETTLQVTPAEAVVCLTDEMTGARVWPNDDGTYILNTNGTYTYTATCYGYVSQTATFAAGEDQKTISITLEQAAENPRGELAQDGDWLSFRGNGENNGVTDAPTPITAENAVLNWANKIGEGMSSGGVGSPILVGGVLYTYANDTVMKVDKQTGEVLLSKPMDHASSFSITPPAYGEGMIFIGLSNGAVQAFDAETLESLWLYEDPLGGQPNCPITYRDGYIYTGFWNSETRQANYVCICVTDEDPDQSKESKAASWTYTGKGFYWAGAYVADDFLLVTTDDGDSGYTKGYGEILSLDCRTGKVLDSQRALGVGDLRSSVCYDAATDGYYFTSKGGDFYSIQVAEDGTFRAGSQRRLHLCNGSDNVATPPMCTSTPVVYNGRAYVGVSGIAQFGAYSGHNITVIDLALWQIAYTVPTQGYPQTSGLLTTAYEEETGFVYVYFIDNYTPGKLRLIRDKAGQTEADPTHLTAESYTISGKTETVQTAYALFTPYGAQAQYAICSPIGDVDGNLYFKNDSGCLMCVGSVITELTVAQKPEKMVYEAGEVFDASGLQVTARYANGVEKDVTQFVQFSQEPLTMEDTEFTLTCSFGPYQQMYQNRDGEIGVEYHVPTATLDLTVCTGHVWDEGTMTQSPTCAQSGEMTFTCTLCGATRNEPIAPTQTHTWDEGTVTLTPTATEPGEMTYTCVVCGAIQVEPIPATGACDGGEQCPSHDFTDVSPNAWYHKAVDYALTNGLMFGMSQTQFQPEGAMTRAQLVTVLWRQAGRPTPAGNNPFADLTADWYRDAVIWAAENGIVYGMEADQFQPNGQITREQLATIVYRYTKDYLQLDTSARQDFAAFEDGQRVSAWAQQAMQWAVAEGLISGSKDGGKLYLNPRASATRAQVASILMRYIQMIETATP